ncbi:MAG: hypothetical protein ACYC8T_30355 [Myxococcaceae bacterium]
MTDAGALSYQPYLDELTAFASTEPKKPDLLVAKAEYAQLTGEVFEDDKQFEMRMASFLDYFLYDRKSPVSGKTPAEECYEERLRTATPEAATAFRSFTETVHGLFEVRKLGKGTVRLRELFSGKDFEVTERRQLAGLTKGDLIEARLVPFGGHLWFSVAFCCHPPASFKPILREVKRRKKKEPQRSPRELTWECSKMALKVDRYQQIAVDKIYNFENTGARI